MNVIALVGESGTGKSYKAIMVARDNNIEYILDDGLLIKGTRVIAGRSAKRESSTVRAVKRALFIDEEHKKNILLALEKEKPDRILILGTSDKMVNRITETLELGEIDKRVYINEISDEEEINTAKTFRTKEGKHVIPVPTFEIKKDFSGYFIDTLKIFKRRENKKEQMYEKTVVRPTFSYLGRYTISNSVLKTLVKVGSYKTKGINKAYNIYISSSDNGIKINLDINIDKIVKLPHLIGEMQKSVISEIEHMTSLNVLSVNVNVKKIIKT